MTEHYGPPSADPITFGPETFEAEPNKAYSAARIVLLIAGVVMLMWLPASIAVYTMTGGLGFILSGIVAGVMGCIVTAAGTPD
jgi:uncharacterized membrane protein HdeD (DUF308 family)